MIILLLVLLGLCFGSFVNAFVWRLHGIENGEKGLTPQQLSIATGRSMCVHCHHELAPKDLIPVISYLTLRGKCRYCHKPIEDTPLPELVTPALFVASYLAWPQVLSGSGLIEFVAWLVFLVGFVALTIYDIRWYELPHRIVLPLIGLALVLVGTKSIMQHDPKVLLTAAIGALIGGGLFYLLYKISPKEQLEDGSSISRWIGGGDITLGVLLGLIVGGPSKAILLLFLASLAGTLVALPLIAAKKADRTSHLPFGPYLILAAIITMLFGSSIINAYTGLFIG